MPAWLGRDERDQQEQEGGRIKIDIRSMRRSPSSGTRTPSTTAPAAAKKTSATWLSGSFCTSGSTSAAMQPEPANAATLCAEIKSGAP